MTEKLVIKHYSELTVDELHDILQARVEVFVVEQDCVYQDIDGYDKEAHHVWLEDENKKVLAYCRVLPKGRVRDVSIGRVITTVRGRGYGLTVMQAAIDTARKIYGDAVIRIEAQKYAKGFYEKLGFKQDSGDFLEDGIPHIEMVHKV